MWCSCFRGITLELPEHIYWEFVLFGGKKRLVNFKKYYFHTIQNCAGVIHTEQMRRDGSGYFSLSFYLHKMPLLAQKTAKGRVLPMHGGAKATSSTGRYNLADRPALCAGSSHVCKCVNWLDKWPGLEITWIERRVRLREQWIHFTSVVGLDWLWRFSRATDLGSAAMFAAGLTGAIARTWRLCNQRVSCFSISLWFFWSHPN